MSVPTTPLPLWLCELVVPERLAPELARLDPELDLLELDLARLELDLARLGLDFGRFAVVFARLEPDLARVCGRFAAFAPEPPEPLVERDALVFRCPVPEADLVAAMVYLPPIEK